MSQKNNRETLASRLGFLFLAAGCAIGIGNVWRFPYVVGEYGGAAFVFLYLLFLVILGAPIMVMELAVGRASRRSIVSSFAVLAPTKKAWRYLGLWGVLGNYILMMFYTTVAGWMIAYLFYTLKGDIFNLSPEQTAPFFNNLLASPFQQVLWMLIAVGIGFGICALGLQKGVEKITKLMMSGLFVIMLILVVRALTLPGAMDGVKFFFKPNFAAIKEQGVGDTIFAAMGQAFFSLSLGIGSIAIFGSYLKKEQSLTGESLIIILFDTLVAILAGLIIFPSTAAFGVDVAAGPGLVFVTIPNIFNTMPLGNLTAILFFVFLAFASLTTVVAVFENIVAFAMDALHWSRRKSVLINILLLSVASLPCALGFNLLSGFAPLGEGSVILDLLDFIVSNNLLPLGALAYLIFCTSKAGWGWNQFIAEADEGKGLRFPRNKVFRVYVSYILPAIILVIFVYGYVDKFFGE